MGQVVRTANGWIWVDEDPLGNPTEEYLVASPRVLLQSDQELFTVEEIAEALRLTDVTVRRLIQDGLLGGYKFGGAFRVTREDFETFVNESRVRKKPETPAASGHGKKTKSAP